MGFFATFWTWLNGQLATYIGDNTARLAGVLEPAVSRWRPSTSWLGVTCFSWAKSTSP